MQWVLVGDDAQVAQGTGAAVEIVQAQGGSRVVPQKERSIFRKQTLALVLSRQEGRADILHKGTFDALWIEQVQVVPGIGPLHAHYPPVTSVAMLDEGRPHDLALHQHLVFSQYLSQTSIGVQVNYRVVKMFGVGQGYCSAVLHICVKQVVNASRAGQGQGYQWKGSDIAVLFGVFPHLPGVYRVAPLHQLAVFVENTNAVGVQQEVAGRIGKGSSAALEVHHQVFLVYFGRAVVEINTHVAFGVGIIEIKACDPVVVVFLGRQAAKGEPAAEEEET